MNRRGCVAAVVLAIVSVDASALAATKKDECIGAFDRGQRARREGHFKEAKESLVLCSALECPAVVRADCADVLRQVDAAQPSIVLKASDAKGADLTDVTVELNGAPIATSLDGRALPVDPGPLALVFKRPPWEPVTVNVVIAETEKNRIVVARLGPPAPAQLPVPPPAKVEDAPARSIVGWAVPGVLAAIGAAGFAFGGIVRLGAGSDAEDLKTRCGPTCPSGERDRLGGELVKANIGLGVGIGGLVLAAATWFILAPRSAKTTAVLMRGFSW